MMRRNSMANESLKDRFNNMMGFGGEEKYNDEEWEEKYKDRQKIQSLTLQKSRLLTDRRIYKELGREDLVDKTTSKIKHLRKKIKELQ